MNLSLLIVDDNQSLANLYQIVFEREGWLVHYVMSGPDALASIAADPPDAVLLDIMMPGMNGVEVCQAIRDELPSPPPFIVVYTANNRPEIRAACLAAGANLVLTKNIPVFDLPGRIRNQIEQTDTE